MYSLESSSTIWLSDTPNVMSNTWDSDYFRIFTFVILKSKNLNKSFIEGLCTIEKQGAALQQSGT